MELEQLNALDEIAAQEAFRQCCTAERWITGMVAARPFASREALQQIALSIWQRMNEEDYLQAFEGHPQIGNVETLRAKYASSKKLAAGEQAGVDSASEDTLRALASGNRQYLEQNGFIFIVCASGKNAGEMLKLLQDRLKNTRAQELAIAAEQQSRITALRLDKLVQ